MADTKITALTALTAADPANDVIPIVDVSDTTMAASGTTKKISVNNILGASGTATLASATITGAATVGTTLGVTGATTLTGSVGIGAANSAKLSVSDTNGIPIRFGDITAAPVSQTACFVGVSTSALSGSINGDLILAPRTSDVGSVVVYTGSGTAAERLRVTAAGNVNITTGNVVMGTSGKGIDFSAKTPDGSGTVGSEVLDDYEEGTWVPVVADAGTGGNVGTCVIGHATYTKIGRQVSVECYISSINTTGMTAGNSFRIRGLPFATVKGGNGNFYTYRVGRNASTASSSAFANDGGSSIYFPIFTTSSGTADLAILVSDITSGTSEFIVSVTYTV